jgi:hypothetical protein
MDTNSERKARKERQLTKIRSKEELRAKSVSHLLQINY